MIRSGYVLAGFETLATIMDLFMTVNVAGGMTIFPEKIFQGFYPVRAQGFYIHMDRIFQVKRNMINTVKVKRICLQSVEICEFLMTVIL